MATTKGVITLNSVTQNSANLSATAATGGTAPYTYQWYRSLVSGFSPGMGSLIAGATELTLNDTGLVPGTQYYYKLIATDDSATPVSATYDQVAALTSAPTQNPNQFSMNETLGSVDQFYAYNTKSAMVDISQSDALYAGQAVKIVDSAGGVPKVVACTADTDEVFGFINYNIKNIAFYAGDAVEISQNGNVIYLYSTEAIARGVQVVLDITTRGGVQAAAGKTGKRIVGYAYDKAANAGVLIRVSLNVPSFTVV